MTLFLFPLPSPFFLRDTRHMLVHRKGGGYPCMASFLFTLCRMYTHDIPCTHPVTQSPCFDFHIERIIFFHTYIRKKHADTQTRIHAYIQTNICTYTHIHRYDTIRSPRRADIPFCSIPSHSITLHSVHMALQLSDLCCWRKKEKEKKLIRA